MASTSVRLNKKKEALAAEDREAEHEAMLILMTKVSGRRFMWNLLAQARVGDDTENLGHGALAYWAGKRSMGLYLQKAIQVQTPEMYLRMVQENASRKINLKLVSNDDEEPEDEEENEDG